MVASAKLAAMDGTGIAVIAGVFLATVAISAVFPLVRLARSASETLTTPRCVARCLGAGVLLAIFPLSTYGAGWLLLSAHRGDLRPYVDTCRVEATDRGYHGSEAKQFVDRCFEDHLADD